MAANDLREARRMNRPSGPSRATDTSYFSKSNYKLPNAAGIIAGIDRVQMGALEAVRRELAVAINSRPRDRAELEAEYGQVWDAAELARDFEVLGFLAPCVVVKRRSDGILGSLLFQHQPRLYFAFQAD